jgi:hypothetical protein
MNKPFDRVITVMFENQYRSYVAQNPFFKKLALAGADMTNYFGVFHPSQTNYLASLAGEVCAVTDDSPPIKPLMQETLVDLLEAKNVSWKAYMEAYPMGENRDKWNKAWENPDYPASDTPIAQYPAANSKNLSRYYRKHNAFASFHSIQKDEKRWNKIVDDHAFWYDMKHKQLPEYSWFTPDIWNDGHYLYNTHIDTDPRTQLVPQQAVWLEHVFLGNIETENIQGGADTTLENFGFNLDVNLLLTDPDTAYANSNIPKGTLIVVTFDEADFSAVGYDTSYDGPNQVYTVLLGNMIKPGTVIDTPYNHYNLIRTVEENFNLGSLNKNDFGANWFRFLWDESFGWNQPSDTEFVAGNALAVTNESSGTHMVFSNTSGQLFESFQTKSDWSQPNELNTIVKGAIALTTIDNVTFLVYKKGAKNYLTYQTYDVKTKKWSEPIETKYSTDGHFALTTYHDMANSDDKLMLCWEGSSGFIQSMTGSANGFTETVIPVGQLTDGQMTLGQIGASLFLVYKERNTRKMRITSYNTGDFNSFDMIYEGTEIPDDNTTLHEWSVTDYPVGHFAKKMAAQSDEYLNYGNMTMATASGEMHLVHRSGFPSKSNVYTEIFGLTGIFSTANQLSDGFGTLNQAGWTHETEMANVNIDYTGPISMCSDGETLTLVWADSNSNTIQSKQGKYSS